MISPKEVVFWNRCKICHYPNCLDKSLSERVIAINKLVVHSNMDKGTVIRSLKDVAGLDRNLHTIPRSHRSQPPIFSFFLKTIIGGTRRQTFREHRILLKPCMYCIGISFLPLHEAIASTAVFVIARIQVGRAYGRKQCINKKYIDYLGLYYY